MELTLTRKKLSAWILVVCLFLIIFSAIILSPNLPFQSWDFKSNLWGPANLLVHGWSPYDIHHLIPDTNAVWLPMVIGLFSPLGWLTEALADKIWFLLTLASLILIIWLSCNHNPLRPVTFALVLITVFLFPPTIAHIDYGQFSILATALFLMVVMIPLPTLLKGFMLALAFSKPQLGLLFFPGIFLYEYRSKGIRDALTLFECCVVGSIVLSLPLFLVQPDFYKKLIANLLGNNKWAQPSSFSFLSVKFGNIGIWIWVFLALAIFILNLWIWVHYPPQKSVLWCLALTALISPYLWSWDFVLLLPLAIALFAQLRTTAGLVLLTAGFVGCEVIEISMRLGTNLPDDRNWWIPIYVLAVFLMSIFFDRRSTLQVRAGYSAQQKY